jgi:hypothetical protein
VRPARSKHRLELLERGASAGFKKFDMGLDIAVSGLDKNVDGRARVDGRDEPYVVHPGTI